MVKGMLWRWRMAARVSEVGPAPMRAIFRLEGDMVGVWCGNCERIDTLYRDLAGFVLRYKVQGSQDANVTL